MRLSWNNDFYKNSYLRIFLCRIKLALKIWIYKVFERNFLKYHQFAFICEDFNHEKVYQFTQ